MKDVSLGDSIAVNGVCLTVTKIKGNTFSFDLSFQTIKKTAFSKYKKGDIVNLEPALRLTDRIDGHLVQGHVDDYAVIKNIVKKDNAWRFDLRIEDKKSQIYLINTGSITVNGISLTIAESKNNEFSLVIIPHSFKNTNLINLKKGDLVNIEYDFIAKYLFHFNKFPNFI